MLAKFPHQVIQFHNVLGNGLVQDIQASYDPVLDTGIFRNDQKYLDHKSRPCEICFVSSQQLDGLTQRVTGLVRTEGNLAPVAIYPPGGHTRLHTDQVCGSSFILF